VTTRKLTELLKRRDELSARERELAEVEAEIARLEAEKNAKERADAEAERQTAIAAARDVATDAERTVGELVVDLDAALAALEMAEGDLRSLTGKPVGKRVSANLRTAVNAELARWARWSPELAGMEPKPTPTPEQKLAADIEAAKRDVREARARLRAKPPERLLGGMQSHLEACERRLALLEGRPAPTDAEVNPERDKAEAEMHEARRRSLAGIPDAAGQLLAGIAKRQAEKAKSADA